MRRGRSSSRHRAGHQLLRHGNVYSFRGQRGIPAALLRDFRPARDLVIATKSLAMRPAERRCLSRKAILHEVERGLKRLGTTTSTPTRSTAGPATPIERRWRAARCRDDGKARTSGRPPSRLAVRQGAARGRARMTGRASCPCRTTTTPSTARGARDGAPLPRPGSRDDPVESSRARRLARAPEAPGRSGWRRTLRQTLYSEWSRGPR